MIPPGGRTPGEGSPRHSGEEADSFLQRRAETSAAGAAAMSQTAGAAASRPPYTAARVPPPTNGSNSSDSTNSNASGFGVLLDRPSLGFLPSMPEHPHYQGRPLSAAEMERLDHENVLPDDHEHYEDGQYSGAYAYGQDMLPPPRLVDPAAAPLLGTVRPPFEQRNSYLSKQSSFHDNEETAILTARRVKVEDLGPRTPSQSPDTPTGPSHSSSHGLLGAIGLGLGGLADLGRKSWFKNFDSQKSAAASTSYEAAPLAEKDLETGRSMLAADREVDSFGNKTRAAGVLPVGTDGSRPRSTISSAASGTTLYHDAQTSLPSTPLLAPPPRALTPAEQPVSEHAWMTSPLAGPPAYEERPLRTPSPAHSHTSFGSPSPTGIDILDMPAPAALNHFSSISSLKETHTGSSVGYKVTPFPPPGLDTVRPVGWGSDTATTNMTSSRGSFGMLTDMEAQHTGVSIDVLEDAPPDAEQGWRRMASAGFGDSGRRGTFGVVGLFPFINGIPSEHLSLQFVPGADLTSEQGSLHSMRSHFSPSVRSTGSAPASRFEVGSVNSNSSRPSAHSNSRSVSSGMQSIARTNSISSDSRKRPGHGAIAPALSAFGLRGQTRASNGGSGSGQHQIGAESPLSPVIGSPPSVHVSPSKTVRSTGSGSTTLFDTSMSTVRGASLSRAGSASPLSTNFPMTAPWAGGLDENWQPSP